MPGIAVWEVTNVQNLAAEKLLSEHLRFAPDAGKIELLTNRMLMFNHAAMTSLRTTTIEQVGDLTARSIFAKFGYESAVHDYRTLGKLFSETEPEQMLAIGPIMHGWCGLVKVIPEFLKSDRASRTFIFRGRWINSYEASAHLDAFGKSPTPVCFSLSGYGSAWCSQFFGIDLLEIERKCIACGDPYCEWEIRPWDDWGTEADPWRQSLKGTDRKIITELLTQQRKMDHMTSNMDKIIASKLHHNSLQLKALCHDLDTPLQIAISSLRDTIISGDMQLTRHAAWSLRQAKGVVERFQRANLLGPSDAGPERKPSSLKPIVHEALKLLNYQIAHKNLTIEEDIDKNVFSYTEPSILRDHILVNILTNAIKFSSFGAKIIIRATQSAPGQASIVIRDHGIGIPAQILKKLRRGQNVSSRRGTLSEKGTGQGLAVADFFTKKLGGKIQIKSLPCTVNPENCGTVVTIMI